jgi:hypothetical protein
LIENASIKRAISGWRDKIIELEYLEQQDYETFQRVLMPFLINETYLPQIGNAARGRPGDPEYAPPKAPVATGGRVDHSALLQDRRFLSILTKTVWDQGDLIQFFEQFIEQATVLRGAIEIELPRS